MTDYYQPQYQRKKITNLGERRIGKNRGHVILVVIMGSSTFHCPPKFASLLCAAHSKVCGLTDSPCYYIPSKCTELGSFDGIYPGSRTTPSSLSHSLSLTHSLSISL
eukprot:sb/3477662/